MAITLQTPNVNMNDGSTYYVVNFHPGPLEREEVWIEPFATGSTPTLAARVDRKTKCEVTIMVKGTSFANLQTKINNVRDEFLTTNNSITWSPGTGATARTFTTYPSPIEAALGDQRTLRAVSLNFVVPAWTFTVWREPGAGNLALLV